ncbi:cytochrome o ubiquinol oxidase subunit III [Acetobacter nitrogenifigens DSM 23921 = NBRC 105050]|uniref:Cytochrome bo(3) ubiquinol oxidase subunit 3 n=1 Tax=Acetobacter nitrogenifigens DSM 23921 = NBRC 105050 TaxID=1120919 RepID=A0A511X729_9PROT|nr:MULTISPECIES: cytochrome o ubiquinol oxidase subunit III [Acetobacter]OUJ15617.1 hypothetical protein HK28_07520 [Acetobacter sp. DsW_063]GBQ95152.1 cytochrome o ubiquinol oxidase subunit III [Acetobacter nitrogenifigens DSM 23921 = NBRC 105050]GEN58731.1 cytochrome o ubiquinol oxidase subunit III [Acetobacter nitrogenifigens DSM 23921 = NBRC 105050]
MAHDTTFHDAHSDHEHHAPPTVFGFWVYLMTDCIIFGTLFAVFATFRNQYAGGPTGKELFEISGLAMETALLLVSSITYGFGMIAAHKGAIRSVQLWLAITFLLGLGFVGLEINEFAHLIGEGAGPDRSAFLSAFFTLVSTHGLHVSCGLIWIVTLVVQLSRVTEISERMMNKLTMLSLFWHFLDIVWICVFSFVYLGSMI